MGQSESLRRSNPLLWSLWHEDTAFPTIPSATWTRLTRSKPTTLSVWRIAGGPPSWIKERFLEAQRERHTG